MQSCLIEGPRYFRLYEHEAIRTFGSMIQNVGRARKDGALYSLEREENVSGLASLTRDRSLARLTSAA